MSSLATPLRSTLRTALGATALALLACAGTAQAQPARLAPQGVYMNVQYSAPPPARREAMPAPRRGQVWVPGYWMPRGHRHVWVAGHWERARAGYVYRKPVWSQRGGQWYYTAGRWDRDGDGVPNRYDRHPGNPNRH